MKELVNCTVEVLSLLYSKRNGLLSSELFPMSIKLVFRNFIFRPNNPIRTGQLVLLRFFFCLIRGMCDRLALHCTDSIQPSKASLLGYHLAIWNCLFVKRMRRILLLITSYPLWVKLFCSLPRWKQLSPTSMRTCCFSACLLLQGWIHSWGEPV